MIYRFSSINTAYTCLRKYQIEYVLGIKPTIGSLELEFGTTVHAAIAAHFAGRDTLSEFSFLWSLVDSETPTLGRYKYEDLTSIGEIMLAKWVKSHAHKYAAMHIEKRVAFKLKTYFEEYSLEGTPDFIGYYNDKLSVVDWKTSAYSYDKRKALVDEQVWVYVEAAKQVYGLDIQQVVYAPLVKDGAKIQNPIVCEVTPARLKEKLDNVLVMLQDLDKRMVFPKNRTQCLRCPHFERCYEEA